ncbi:MAG: divalent-cation tolerance protein CutA [Pseudomonadota bacterium]|nr:divalent-cation tolerance protein CutA [Pseudomonadota bacterium]
MTHILLVLTTVATRADADGLARSMVGQRLAACAHIETIDSVYRWDGAVQAEGEYRLLFKTDPSHHDDLIDTLRREHPYKLPALVTLRSHDVTPDYARWVNEQTR